ncbi:D-glucuronyl C5-epimerase family protein [Tangfeifania diversioriginum]|nr:D-glucuronyl C5-epimerase family protein [Tangfeifania diversioriginum]
MDSTYYHKCVNQINYFKDSSKVNVMFNGKGIGLPYNFNYGGLKAPWYSGMTQGYAISYLLRYYDLTDDETILPIIKKIAFVLISPQEDGGTISTTKEGCTWIEEYPNSTRSKQVLNGFINGLIGLFEYCNFFDNDLKAKQIFNEAYECLKTSLEYYDTPTWSYYNRSNSRLTDGYMRYQIYEMKFLVELFQEPLFDAQMRIWSIMLSDKLKNKRAHKKEFVNPYNSRMVEKMNDSLFYLPVSTQQRVEVDSLQIFNFKSMRECRRYLKGKNQKRIKKISDLAFLCFELPQTDSTDYLKINFNGSNLTTYKITAYKKPERNPRRAKEIKFKKFCNGNQLLLSFPEMDISDLLLKFENKENFSLPATTVDFFNTSKAESPYFGHHISQPFELKKENTYKIGLPVINTDQAVLFYKFTPADKKISDTKWKAINTLNLNDYFTPAKSGKFSFMLVFKRTDPLNFIGNFKINTSLNN